MYSAKANDFQICTVIIVEYWQISANFCKVLQISEKYGAFVQIIAKFGGFRRTSADLGKLRLILANFGELWRIMANFGGKTGELQKRTKCCNKSGAFIFFSL
jgi:hypothetical protein